MVVVKQSPFARLRNRASRTGSSTSTALKLVTLAIGIGSLMMVAMLHADLSTGDSFLAIGGDEQSTLLSEILTTNPDAASLNVETRKDTSSKVDKEAIKAARKRIVAESCNVEGSDLNAATTRVLNRVTTEMFTTVPTKNDPITPHSPRPDVRKCKNVILDFGANVGDTAAHVIDAGLPNCAKDLHFDLHEKTLLPQNWNKVTKFLKGMMEAMNHSPEDYCYYGIEGNPVFTERLRGIEDYIHSIEPKPVEHAAFFTESVGAGEVGMTKLYLDTVNTKENFWGSSIMQNHQDVRKSKDANNMTNSPYHDVMGYTITKLMNMTLKGMDSDATEEVKKGGHLLMKVDIEGGEYVLTQEVVQSGALCQFVAAGNTADVIIETHSQRVTGPNPLARKFGGWKKQLEECGVTFRTLQAHWA